MVGKATNISSGQLHSQLETVPKADGCYCVCLHTNTVMADGEQVINEEISQASGNMNNLTRQR